MTLTGHTTTCEMHMIKKAWARTMEPSVRVFYTQFIGLELVIVFIGTSEGIVVVIRGCELLGCKTGNLWRCICCYSTWLERVYGRVFAPINGDADCYDSYNNVTRGEVLHARTCVNNSGAIIITLITELRASRIGGRIKFKGEINSRKYCT